VDREIQDLVYKRILLRSTEDIKDISSALELDQQTVQTICESLRRRRLIKLSSGAAAARKWWEESHLELFISPSWLTEDRFKDYCIELEFFAETLRGGGFEAIRPITNETSVIVILTSAALTVGGLVTKKFLEKLGEKFAEFIARAIIRTGTKNIELKGVKQLADGTTLSFSVAGEKTEEIIRSFGELVARIEYLQLDAEKNKRLSGLHDSAKGWQITIK
jgi:hypothetical protein